MKTLFTLSLSISLLMCLLSSCEKESIVAPIPYDFEGEWIWVKTTSGWADPLYPESLGHSISLIIDHTKYSMLVDNVVSNRWNYEFQTDTNNFGTIIESILLETGKQYSVNLVLDDGWADSSVWHYVRK